MIDSTGAEVASFEYDGFGNILSAAGDRPDISGRFAFTGREWDAETGLYYYRARYYDPELGRFISRDPIGFESGDANLFRYARNSPIRFRDPTGTLTALEYQVIISAAFALTAAVEGQIAGELAVICSGGGPFAMVAGGVGGFMVAGGGTAAAAALGGGILGAAGGAIVTRLSLVAAVLNCAGQYADALAF